MPIGDSVAQSYVIEEFVRRHLGRSVGHRGITEADLKANAIGAGSPSQNLSSWWHLRKPYIRMVSNAVPHAEADKLKSEWAAATEVYGEEPSNDTRFLHVLYGGTGISDGDKTRLNHDFRSIYNIEYTPFSAMNQDFAKTEDLHKPMPGITNIDVSYKGDRGALKKAVIQFKCYSLGDLERLEKLYMLPGIKVLLEWGWSINTANSAGDFSSEDVQLVPLDDATLKSVGEVHKIIAQNRRDSGGCMDGMMGTVTNFSWNVQADLSFNCTVDITDIGDSIFTSNVNSPEINKKTEDEEVEDGKAFTLSTALSEIETQIEAAGRKDPNEVGTVTVSFKNTLDSMDVTFFRMARGTVSKLSSDSKKTKKRRRCYIKFGDVVDQLLNRLYMITSEGTKADAADASKSPRIAHAMFSIGGALKDGKITNVDVKGISDTDKAPELPVSVISNHEYLISTDPDVCLLPGQTGAAPYTVQDEMDSGKFNSYAPSGLDADPNIKFACTTDQAKDISQTENGPNGFDESKKQAGLLANIFVNTDMLQDEAEAAGSVADFLNGVTNKINTACGDIWAYNWTMTDEHPGVMTCIDRNFYWDGTTTALELPVSSLSGIIKTLSMKSAINSRTANALFIAANASKTGDQVSKSSLLSKGLIPLDVDFSIDGMSGIQMGTSFAVDYMPARYRDMTYLFAYNVNHSVDADKWDTNITCKFRFASIENGMKKIHLNLIENTKPGLPPIDIATEVTQETIDVGAGQDVVTDAEQTQGIMPQGIFQSLEAQGVTIGAKTGDLGEGGITSEESKEKTQTREELAEKLSKTLGVIYHKGTSQDIDNVNNAYSYLLKILYMPEE